MVRVNHSQFTNTYRSIFFSGTNNAEVLLNNIKVADMPIGSSTAPYGIYINGGKGFRVEENLIYRPGSNGASKFNGARGIIVNNTGAENNQIYKNNLDNLFLSEQAQGCNSGKGNLAIKGLQFYCNQSETDAASYDFFVFGHPYLKFLSLNWSGIATTQKQKIFNSTTNQFDNSPTGNTFSSTHQSVTMPLDFDNGLGQTVEYYWGDITNYTQRVEPLKYDNVIKDWIPGTHDACPSKISIGGNGSNYTDLYTSLTSARVGYNSSKVILDI